MEIVLGFQPMTDYQAFAHPVRWPLLLLVSALVAGSGCSSRQVQDSMVGSTAQRLVTYAIDDMIAQLPAADFEALRGQRVLISSHFVEESPLQDYADERLAIELNRRFDIEVVREPLFAQARLSVFYTSLGTDSGLRGLFLPIGYLPGFNETTQVNLISLEQFHGVAEMYYFVGETGTEQRGAVIQARMRSDALGLPIITIPLSNIDRR
jgi:hypothetical protein